MYLLASFRMERVGTATMTWDGTSVSVSSGRYAHVQMTSIDAACVAFADALEDACIAAGKTSASVGYSTTTHAYTLSNGGGSFAIAFPATTAGTLMARILGFQTGATATSHTSTVRPYYVIVPQIDGRSRYTGLRHEGTTARRQADDGFGFALGTSSPVITGQWEHWHEPLAAVFDYAATSAAPWTWEAFWRHAGRWQELVLVQPHADDPEPAGVWQLTTPDFDDSTHERQFADGDFAWKVRVAGVRVGDHASAEWTLDYGDGTFSRSSEASYLTAAPTDGTTAFLSWASSNVLREENRGDGGGALALFEGARTNVALRSQELDNASWTTAGTVTKTAGLGGPDGNNAERLQAASGTNILYQSISFTAGRWALSAWARATSGTISHFLIYYDGASVYDGPSATLTTTYERLANAQTVGTGAGNIEVIDGRNVGSFSAGARDARLDLVQLEAGRFASSAIRTTTASVTRAADTLTFAVGDYNENILDARAGFAQVSPVFATSSLTSGDVFVLLSLGDADNCIRIRHTGTDVRIEAVQGGVVKASSAAQTWSAHALLGTVRWDPSLGIVYVNGVAGATGTAWSWTAGVLRIGGVYGASSEAFCRLGALESW